MKERLSVTLDRAAKTVRKWPKWKRDALGTLRPPFSAAARGAGRKKNPAHMTTGWGILLAKEDGEQELFRNAVVYSTRSEARYIARRILSWGNAEEIRVVKLQITAEPA